MAVVVMVSITTGVIGNNATPESNQASILSAIKTFFGFGITPTPPPAPSPNTKSSLKTNNLNTSASMQQVPEDPDYALKHCGLGLVQCLANEGSDTLLAAIAACPENKYPHETKSYFDCLANYSWNYHPIECGADYNRCLVNTGYPTGWAHP